MNVMRPAIAFLGLLLNILPAWGAEGDLNAPKMTIPLSPKARTILDLRKERRAWTDRTMVKPFREGLKGHPSDKFSMPFVEQAAADWADVNDFVDYKDVLDLGQRAMDAGCEDPLVLYLWSYLKSRQIGDAPLPLIKMMVKASKQLMGSRYPKGVWLQVVLDFRAACIEKHVKSTPTEETIVKLSREALRDGSFPREQEHLFVAMVVRQSKVIVKLLQPVVESSNMEEWAKKTILGFRETDAAWEARGDGWANTVTEEGWKGFREHLGKAREALNEAWKLRPDQPYAAAKMITVVMGGSGSEDDTIEKWFDRAVSAQLDVGMAYDNRLTALMPRWGGSNEKILELGRACLATKRFDTNVPFKYLQCVQEMIGEDPDPMRFYRRADIARDIASLEAALSEPKRKAERSIIGEKLALMGWLSGNYEMAGRALKEIKGPWHYMQLVPLAAYGINVTILRSEVEIATSGAREAFVKAEDHYHAGRYREAEDGYRSVAAKCPDTKHPPFQIVRRLAAIQLEKQLESGEWVSLKPDLESWQIRSGAWSVADDGALVNTGTDEEAVILAPVRSGTDFEVRGEFQITTAPKDGQTFGLILGWREAAPKGWITCMTLQDEVNPPFTLLLDGFSLRKGEDLKDTKIEAKNQFLAQCWHGKLSYYLNREPTRKDFPVKSKEWQDEVIGFGAPKFYHGALLTIRNLELRRLKSAPVAP